MSRVLCPGAGGCRKDGQTVTSPDGTNHPKGPAVYNRVIADAKAQNITLERASVGLGGRSSLLKSHQRRQRVQDETGTLPRNWRLSEDRQTVTSPGRTDHPNGPAVYSRVIADAKAQ